MITGTAYGARSVNRLFEKSLSASAAAAELTQAIARARAMAHVLMVNVLFCRIPVVGNLFEANKPKIVVGVYGLG